MLGYIPKWIQTPKTGNEQRPSQSLAEPGEEPDSDLKLPGSRWQFLWEKRDEQRDRMTVNIATAHARWERSYNPQWTKSKPGDLVLVRDIQKDKQHGKKLDSRWMGPRLLVSLRSPVTGYVRNVYGGAKHKNTTSIT